jgi:quercetin dioxygenase-like cupin family protein
MRGRHSEIYFKRRLSGLIWFSNHAPVPVFQARGFKTWGIVMHPVSTSEIFKTITEYWSPVLVAELNGQELKAAKVKGEFIWHQHDNGDEMFMVVKGQLTIKFRDGDKTVGEGESIVISKGVEHMPVAEEETWVLLFEPAGTVNTGNIINDMTKEVRR